MKKMMLLAAVLVLGLAAVAQDTVPKVELAIDYSYVRYNPSHAYVKNGYSLNGAGGGVTYNFTDYIGLKMELTGYGSNTKNFTIPTGSTVCPSGCSGNVQANLFTYLFGPQVGLRKGKIRPFGHLLFGGGHSNVYGNLYKLSGVVGKAPSGNGFTMVFGGGVDIPLNHSGTVAIRPGEIDYLYTRFNNSVTGAQSNLRYQGGIVLNFGGR